MQVTHKPVILHDAESGSLIEAIAIRVEHPPTFGYAVHTYSARTAHSNLIGENAENAIYLAFDIDVRGTTDQAYFEIIYAVCSHCQRPTRFTLEELHYNDKNAPIIHEIGGGHHIGELLSDGTYD